MAWGKKKDESAGADERDVDLNGPDVSELAPGELAEASDPPMSDSEGAGSEGESGALNAELAVAQAEARENYDKYLRALAEFENFKKRVQKERSELLRYQGEQVFVDILDVLDNLELALQYKDSEVDQLRGGLELIHKKFVEILAKWEVVGRSGVGEPFDPNKYQAISKIPAQGDALAGTVVNELKRAYFYKDKLIRAGEVVVAE